MTESDARWAMYEMNAEQIDIMLDGAEAEYINAVELRHDAVVMDDNNDCEEEYRRVVMAHDLLNKLRNIQATISGSSKVTAEDAAQDQ